MLSRRALLRAAAQGAAAWPLLPLSAGAAAPRPLREIAASRGLLYGTYVRGEMLGTDPRYTELAAREAALIVCSCPHWRNIAPTPTKVDYSKVEAAYAWARAHGMAYRGHALLWGEAAPRWFGELPDRAAATRALEEHIAGTCRHFAGRLHSWDVVNEAIKIGDGRPDRLRRNVFLDKIGPEYLDLAFHTARASDPRVKLVYNEFDVEYDIPHQRNNRAALFDLLDGFKKRGTPIDAIGLQSHL